jgi:cytochrome b involved in lipid metabolism
MKIIFPIALIIIAGILGWFLFFQPESEPIPVESTVLAPEGADEVVKEEARAERYTLAEVATHHSAQNCWTVIRGDVYDLTEWVGKHPGGSSAILQLCGIDGTALFEGQHGGSEKQEAMLPTFKIGTLAQ